MGYTKMVAIPPQIKWGKKNDARAREVYLQKMRSLGHRDIECQPSGLTLMHEHSYLGASGDRIIKNHRYHGENPGVLEIKCPFSVDKVQVTQRTPADIAKEHKSFFLEYDVGGRLRLKRTSAYYFQVQGEMAIKKCTWAHFVVWTECDVFIEEILFDENQWNTVILPKLQSFYIQVLVPEILTRKIQQSL